MNSSHFNTKWFRHRSYNHIKLISSAKFCSWTFLLLFIRHNLLPKKYDKTINFYNFSVFLFCFIFFCTDFVFLLEIHQIKFLAKLRIFISWFLEDTNFLLLLCFYSILFFSFFLQSVWSVGLNCLWDNGEKFTFYFRRKFGTV